MEICLHVKETLLVIYPSWEPKGNKFHGNHSTYMDKWLPLKKWQALSQNQLEGQLPRSLANCTIFLEVLDKGKQQDQRQFSFNRFYGSIGDPLTTIFSGHLPSGYFQQWKAMAVSNNAEELICMEGFLQGIKRDRWNAHFSYSMTVTKKGRVIDYGRIQNFFKLIDLSSNMFEREIPELILLNLSSNILYHL